MKKDFCLILPVLLLLFSCGSSRKATRTEHKTLPEITVSANNPFDIYRASEPRFWDIAHTRVALSFDFKNRTADGKAWLDLQPYGYPTDTLVLDAKGMEIDSVEARLNDKNIPVQFNYKEDKLYLNFDRMLHRAEKINLFIKYTAKPYVTPTGGSKAITDDRGLYFINTNNEVAGKPVQIWTQGETEANAHWLPTLDRPNERMTVQIELTVPDSFKTLSNGALINSKKDGGLRTDVWAMKKPIQVYAAMFAIGRFSVVEDKPWNGVPVNYYVEPEFAPYARKMFNNTPEMIEYFSKITGVAYPWNKYSQIVVRDYVSGAMENTTASLFGEFMNQNFREIADRNYEDIVSHELFHQWFGDYVTAESWSNLTVNESFANYGEQLWRLHKYGKASNDELAFNDLAKYLNQTPYNDAPLVRFHYRDKEDMFDRISYEKGGAVLRYLHGLMGDEAFFKAMNIYLTENALQSAEAHHWRLAVEEATGMDWNWFFNQWYYRAGHPALTVDYTYDDEAQQLIVTAKQVSSDSGKAYNLPLKAALIYGNDLETTDWHINSKKQVFKFLYKNGVKPLFIPDYEHWLVGTIKENKTPQQWLAQLRQSKDYINKHRAVTAAFRFSDDTISLRLMHEALKDELDGIRALTLGLLEKLSAKTGLQKQFENEIAMLALNDGSSRVRAAAWRVTGSWTMTSLQNEMIQALADSSYEVAGAALMALQKINKDTAYRRAKNIVRQNPKAELENAAWYTLAAMSFPEDMDLFTLRAPYVYGTKKISLATYLSLYLENMQDTLSFEKGLKTLTRMAATESIKSYRFAIGSILFGLSNYYEEGSNISLSAAEIKQRMILLQRYKMLLLEQETDPGNLKKYELL